MVGPTKTAPVSAPACGREDPATGRRSGSADLPRRLAPATAWRAKLPRPADLSYGAATRSFRGLPARSSRAAATHHRSTQLAVDPCRPCSVSTPLPRPPSIRRRPPSIRVARRQSALPLLGAVDLRSSCPPCSAWGGTSRLAEGARWRHTAKISRSARLPLPRAQAGRQD
ncbi:unnamed protein product [Urochloa humidicola]